MVDRNSIFFELLQVAVGNRRSLTRTLSAEEWEEIYDMAKKQALVGVCFYGVKQLSEEQMPPKKRLMQWALVAFKLEDNNKRLSQECRMITSAFAKGGFETVILKGQGNLALYPEHLRLLRTPGDIDVWCLPDPARRGACKHPVRTLIEYCQKVKKGSFVFYHNLDFPVLPKTPVEVHYRPTWLFCPWRDRVLQKWMRDRFAGIDYDGFKIPTVEFNLVFQLLHIYKHLFEEGIGLRQLLDYYFVLVGPDKAGVSDVDKQQLLRFLNKIGLRKFAGAVMFVLREVFALGEEYMICPANEKEGQILLSEIMLAGNFGHHDERYDFASATSGERFNGWSYAWLRLRRNFTFLKSYPLEVLFEPPFRVYHWLWRTFKLWRF